MSLVIVSAAVSVAGMPEISVTKIPAKVLPDTTRQGDRNAMIRVIRPIGLGERGIVDVVIRPVILIKSLDLRTLIDEVTDDA